ncbi:MAG: hypothetical protein ACPGXK_12460, partial [Phycisphaerae bacterium]
LAGQPARAHVFVSPDFQQGPNPLYEGTGWMAEAYLEIPDESAGNLFAAEAWSASRSPDLTFRTDWIDFPAGPTGIDLDANFETMDDFLGGHAYELSDPAQMERPFGNFLLKFTGYLAVRFEDDISSLIGPPLWVDFGTLGYDGYRLVVGETIYRFPKVPLIGEEPVFFWRENPICEVGGLFRIEFTYLNIYDTDPDPDPTVFHTEYTGIELYTWHGSELDHPGGLFMIHPERGQGTIIPPRVIYQEEDQTEVITHDFDADQNIDLFDFGWMQNCFSGPVTEESFFLDPGCFIFDSDEDGDLDLFDYPDFTIGMQMSSIP